MYSRCTAQRAQDADVLLFMVDSTPQASREWIALQASELWNQLKAGQEGRVYQIETEKRFEYSAWSHDRAQTYLMRMLT